MKLKRITDKIKPALRRYGVKRASIFGSFVKGQERGNSDIDILVEFEGNRSLLDLAGLKMDLEKILKRNVDVLTYNSLHPLLRDRILAEQKVIL